MPSVIRTRRVVGDSDAQHRTTAGCAVLDINTYTGESAVAAASPAKGRCAV